MTDRKSGFTHIGDISLPLLKRAHSTEPQSIKSHGPTPIERRLIEGAVREIEDPDTPLSLLYQHTVLCQTCLPFRDPGNETRTWERLNGNIHLEVNAGKAMHPEQGRLIPLGLPFGPKARMVLMHINQQAL